MSKRAPTLQAAIWMIGAIVSFSAMAIAGRELGPALDTFEIMTYRSLIGLLIMLTIAMSFGKLKEIGTGDFSQHLIRNAAHFIGQNLWFFAVTMIPLAQVFALEFTSPLWVLVLATFILGERLTWQRAFAALLGFAGVMIITRPGAMELSYGVIAAASAAVFFAITALYTSRLTRTNSITSILFWLTFLQAIFGLVCAGFDGRISLPKTGDLHWVVLIACAGLFAHFCLTKALSLAPASVITPIDFTRLPLIAMVGLLVYGEALDAWIILGGAVVVLANVINLRSEQRAP